MSRILLLFFIPSGVKIPRVKNKVIIIIIIIILNLAVSPWSLTLVCSKTESRIQHCVPLLKSTTLTNILHSMRNTHSTTPYSMLTGANRLPPQHTPRYTFHRVYFRGGTRVFVAVFLPMCYRDYPTEKC